MDQNWQPRIFLVICEALVRAMCIREELHALQEHCATAYTAFADDVVIIEISAQPVWGTREVDEFRADSSPLYYLFCGETYRP